MSYSRKICLTHAKTSVFFALERKVANNIIKTPEFIEWFQASVLRVAIQVL